MSDGLKKIFFIKKMSQESSQSSEYISSQTPDSEDYTSYESSSIETPSESDYSIASSSQCSGSSDYNSSYFDSSQSSTESEEEYIEQFKIDGSRSSQPDVKI